MAAPVATPTTPLIAGRGINLKGGRGLTMAGPTVAGLIFGVAMFGDSVELKNLMRNAITYSSELKKVKDDQYRS